MSNVGRSRMSIAFYLGWMATVGLLCVHVSWPAVGMIALFGAATVSLYCLPEFPYRYKGLATSWVGPLILAIANLVEWRWFAPDRDFSQNDSQGIFNNLILNGLSDAAIAAAWATWFVRGYGMVTFFSLISRVVPRVRRAWWVGDAKGYPPRWWWVLPPISAGKGLMLAGFTYFVVRPNFLKPPEDYMRTALLSPDGLVIATGGSKPNDGKSNNEIRIYSANDRKLQCTILDDADYTKRLAFSPDGTLLAASVGRGPRDHKKYGVEIWDWRYKKKLQYIIAPSVYSVSFSADGKRIAGGAGKNAVRIWDVASGKLLRTVKDSSGCAIAVALSPNGHSVASGGCNAGVTVSDLAAGSAALTLKETGGPIYCIGFSPDGKILATGGKDKAARVWDASSGHLLRTLSGARGALESLVFSPDGSLLTGGSADGRIYLWNTTDWNSRWSSQDYHGTAQLSFAPDGQSLVSLDKDDKLRTWNINRDFSEIHEERLSSALLSPDGRSIVTAGWKRDGQAVCDEIRIYSAQNQTLQATFFGQAKAAGGLAFSPDGRLLAVQMAHDHQKRGIEIWDWRNKKLMHTVMSPNCYEIGFSPDGKLIAGGGEPNELNIWEVVTGKLLRAIKGQSGYATCATFSSDGKTIASGGSDSVVLSDVATGRAVRKLTGNSGAVYNVCFSHDGKTIAGGGKDKMLRLWDAATGKLLRTLSGPSELIEYTAFSPDGSLLAAGSLDHGIYLWNTADWKPRSTLHDYYGAWQFSFASDGRSIVGIDKDGKLRTWAVG